MNQTEQQTEIMSPAQRAEIVAAFACLGCMAYLFSVGKPALELLQAGWVEVLVCVLIPMTLTFTILHGSCIHREMARWMRAGFLFLVACLIFGGDFVFMVVVIFCSAAFPGIGRTGP